MVSVGVMITDTWSPNSSKYMESSIESSNWVNLISLTALSAPMAVYELPATQGLGFPLPPVTNNAVLGDGFLFWQKHFNTKAVVFNIKRTNPYPKPPHYSIQGNS